jgi:PAS domain S-box-containing protein
LIGCISYPLTPLPAEARTGLFPAETFFDPGASAEGIADPGKMRVVIPGERMPDQDPAEPDRTAGAPPQPSRSTSPPLDALYRTLVERVPDIGIFMLDPDGHIVSWNVGALQVTGFRRAEILGQHFSVSYPREERGFGAGGERLREVVAQRRIEEQGWLQRKDGTRFWADLTLPPLHDEEDRLVGYAVILHDRTERRQAAERQRRLSAMMKATPDFVSFSDPRGRVLYINDAGRKMLGIGEEEVARLNIEDCHPEWATALILNEGIPTTIRQGAWRGETALLTRSGREIPVYQTLVAHKTPAGAIDFFSVSDRRYGAADLRFAEELASRAALAIDNARLYQGEREAVNIRDEVLSSVAHDLRNPLGTISMTAELLLDTTPPEDEEARGKFEIIDRAAQGMNRLIQDLLDVTRIEGGQGLAIEPEREEVGPLVEEACEMLRPHAEDKGLRLSCELPEHLPAVRADRDRILQVFSNLIGNALKFTEHGAIMVRAESAEGAVRFAVSDTGPGISQEDLPHLFERFWQARKARKGGAGLGLAITRGIVEAHGGRIWVASRVGEGTTFYFTLPVAGEARLAQAAD